MKKILSFILTGGSELCCPASEIVAVQNHHAQKHYQLWLRGIPVPFDVDATSRDNPPFTDLCRSLFADTSDGNSGGGR